MKKPKALIYCIIVFLSFAPTITLAALLCGDANGNGKVELSDISCIINALYRGGPAPISRDMVDVDNSGNCNLRDVAFIISYLYRNGLDLVCPGDTPSGGLIGHGPCKNHLKALTVDTVTNMHDCIAYNYDGLGMLSIQHINAGLNCCPVFASDVTIEGNNIIIEEYDPLGPESCLCMCIFDLGYRISNLAPGLYHFKIIEPHVGDDMEQLEFDADLSGAASGLYCVLRDIYPWVQ